MARVKKRTSQVEQVRPYVEGVAKNLIDKLYGPDGPVWGTKLTAIEDLFVAIREVLSEKMLADALARQAAAQAQGAAPSRSCPGCQQSLVCAHTNGRIVETRAGDAEWAEPEGYCDRCRRSFFPSEPVKSSPFFVKSDVAAAVQGGGRALKRLSWTPTRSPATSDSDRARSATRSETAFGSPMRGGRARASGRSRTRG